MPIDNPEPHIGVAQDAHLDQRDQQEEEYDQNAGLGGR
jgi:hypothetical protein